MAYAMEARAAIEKLRPHAPMVLKVVCVFFSVVGVFATIRFVWASIISGTSDSPKCPDYSSELCPWKHVFTDIAHRLQLLELAFKEQVVAREAMAMDVQNQSDINIILYKKLSTVIDKLDHLEKKYDSLAKSVSNLNIRVQSNESIWYALFFVVLIEIILKIRPLQEFIHKVKEASTEVKEGTKSEAIVSKKNSSPAKNGSISFAPRHGISLKNELCVTLFNRDSDCFYVSLTENIVRQFGNVKLSVKPSYYIDSQEDLRHLPTVRLYLLFADADLRRLSPQETKHGDSDIRIAAIKMIQSLGATVILVFTNDEGSKKLTAHTQYNAGLRLVHSHNVFQELASQGRLFSIWKELSSHQISHLRKTMLTILSPKH